MSDIAIIPDQKIEATAQEITSTLLAGVLVMSFGSLLLELALTRLFSVILFYHFAFLAISIALLGLGAGGVFAYIRKDWLARWSTRQIGAAVGLLNAGLMVVVLEVDLHIPVSLDLNRGNLLRLTGIYLVSAMPFFLTGLCFSVVFARKSSKISRLYAADLAGGALACLGIVPLLNFVGGPNTILAGAAAMAASGAIWADTSRMRRAATVAALVLAALIGANYSGRLIDIVFAKGMRRDQPWVEYARWNAISRVEVDDQGGAKVVVIDADASTYIMNTDPKNWGPEWRRNLMSAAPSVVNVLRPRGEYAIIGPGGGVDVLRAVANGSPNVTGIEINPIIADNIMRGRYAGWAHHLYERPEVHIHVNDGRSWVRGSDQKFDVVQMTLVDTWASTAAGAFALSENNLYTTEAFREYFDHLAPDGIIAITRWEFRQPREALRVVSQEIEVLRQMGVQDVRGHFIIVADGNLTEDGRPVTVMVKKSEFTPEEETAVFLQLMLTPNLYMVYSPREHGSVPADTVFNIDWSCPPVNGAPTETCDEPTIAVPAKQFVVKDAAQPFINLINLGNSFAATYPFKITPVSDDAPFFFFTLKPQQVLEQGIHGMDWKVNLGVVVLGLLLIISVVAVALFLILPLALHARARRQSALRLLYFVAIGLGYIIAEVAFIQRFVLFLGHPVYALTVVVFLMLLTSGLGSLVSRRLLSDPLRVWLPILLIVAGFGFYFFGLAPLLRTLVGLPFAAKLLVSALLLAPLGFAMGMPFPSGLRALAGEEENAIEWAWAMNAASSVLGSVLAMVIAIQFGLGITLLTGAVCYLLAAALTSRLQTA